jgi:hypothetical protein
LFAQCPEWLSPSMSDVEQFLSAADGKRRAHAHATARVRLHTALRQRSVRPDPLVLQNGDMFLFWRSGPGTAPGSYKGPAVCIGQYRALVVGFQGGHLVTAHESRCLLHRRSPLYEQSCDRKVALPDSRDRSMESPLEDQMRNFVGPGDGDTMVDSMVDRPHAFTEHGHDVNVETEWARLDSVEADRGLEVAPADLSPEAEDFSAIMEDVPTDDLMSRLQPHKDYAAPDAGLKSTERGLEHIAGESGPIGPSGAPGLDLTGPGLATDKSVSDPPDFPQVVATRCPDGPALVASEAPATDRATNARADDGGANTPQGVAGAAATTSAAPLASLADSAPVEADRAGTTQTTSSCDDLTQAAARADDAPAATLPVEGTTSVNPRNDLLMAAGMPLSG